MGTTTYVFMEKEIITFWLEKKAPYLELDGYREFSD